MTVTRPTHEATPYALARTADLVVRELDGEVLVYDLKSHRASALSPLVGRVWRACDGASDVTAIAARLSSGEVDRVGPEDVSLALEQLREANLIAGGSPSEPPLHDRRRRAVVTGGAGAAMIAVTTFVAPRPFAIHSVP